jgi:peptide/nickel transport system substrate-binding protein
LSDHAARVPYFQKIEKVVAAQLPYIPLFGQQDETEFNAAVVTNYPTESNLYAMPTEWLSGNSGWVAARLRPVS